MATLGEVKTRIIEELDRDDMESGDDAEGRLVNAITRAIEFHSDEEFWFNRASGTGNTAASAGTIAIPSGIRIPSVVAYDGVKLRSAPLASFEYRTETGRPREWAENEGAIQLWPIPDGTYSLSVFGLADTGVPDDDGSSNIWTTEAEDLIVATAKKRLCRGPFRDVDGALLAQGEEGEALTKLRRETRRRGRSRLVSDIPSTRETFNIMTG